MLGKFQLLLKPMKGCFVGQDVRLRLVGVAQGLTHAATTDDEAIGPGFVAGKRPQARFALMSS